MMKKRLRSLLECGGVSSRFSIRLPGRRSAILQRRCDLCRHDRTKYSGDFDVEIGCAVLDDGETVPGSVALKKYNDSTLDHIVEHGGCPAWQPWELCEEHGLPTPPGAECDRCEEEIGMAEEEYLRELWREEAILSAEADNDADLDLELGAESGQFFEQAKRGWEELYAQNARLLVNKWGFGAEPELIAQVIADVAATLRSILLRCGHGIDAIGRIEGVEREPYFEVTVHPSVRLSALPGDGAGSDTRVQISGLEIAHALQHRLGVDSETALQLWKSLATASEDWAKNALETSLLPNLYLEFSNQSVVVALDQTVDFGLD